MATAACFNGIVLMTLGIFWTCITLILLLFWVLPMCKSASVIVR